MKHVKYLSIYMTHERKILFMNVVTCFSALPLTYYNTFIISIVFLSRTLHLFFNNNVCVCVCIFSFFLYISSLHAVLFPCSCVSFIYCSYSHMENRSLCL
jgi:hypothetical protein